MPSRVRNSIPCGIKSSSSSTKDLRPTSSFLKRRSWRLRPEPILKSLSSRRTKCIAVRLLARNRRTMELPRLASRSQEAGYLLFLQLLDTIYTSPPHRSAHPSGGTRTAPTGSVSERHWSQKSLGRSCTDPDRFGGGARDEPSSKIEDHERDERAGRS